eukprot:TRINITY_DN5570_c0_g2_i2.p1 TRINITY_DN5570_c0_g2~~TRINITY_DN5570_c0_g2_i2.p1  ORF type:complete len:265 (+),score=40.16 TRINITY_DN5570_c0_g2_i2:68-862(+)
MEILDRNDWKFTPIDVKLETFGSTTGEEFLRKWDLWEHSQVATFSFDTGFRRGMAEDFVNAFFNDPNVKSEISLKGSKGEHIAVDKGTVKAQFEPLECSLTKLDLFEKLEDAGIVRENGAISKMMDQFLDAGVTVSDELRWLLMCEDESDHAGLFTEDEQNEFLYHVLHRVASGGALCQYEDDFTIYRNIVKGIYKDLVSVRRNPTTSQPECASHIYRVTSLTQPSGTPLFGRPGFPNQNFCYLCVNPNSRHVYFWYNAFVSPF